VFLYDVTKLVIRASSMTYFFWRFLDDSPLPSES